MKRFLAKFADLLQSLRRRKAARVVGWSLVASFGFMACVWMTFPTHLLAWRIGYEARKAGFNVRVEDVGISPFGSVSLEGIDWVFEPSRDGDMPTRTRIEEVEVSLSLLALLIGDISITAEAGIDEGRIVAEYSGSFAATKALLAAKPTSKKKRKKKKAKKPTGPRSELHVRVEALPLWAVPKAQQAFNAPLRGTFEMNVDLELPGSQFSQAEGLIGIACHACRVGDGETLLFVPGVDSGLLAKGVTLPEIDFGKVGGVLAVKDGVAKIQEAIGSESEHLSFSVNGGMQLDDPFSRSTLDFEIKFELKASLLDQAEGLRLMYETASEKSRLDPPEQGRGYVLVGQIKKPKFRGIKALTPRQKRDERRRKALERQRERSARRARIEEREDRDKASAEKEKEDAPKVEDAPAAAEEPPSPPPAEAPSEAAPAEADKPKIIVEQPAAVAEEPSAEPAPDPESTPAQPEGNGEDDGGGEGAADGAPAADGDADAEE